MNWRSYWPEILAAVVVLAVLYFFGNDVVSCNVAIKSK